MEQAMPGLDGLNQGLRLRHIAAFPLLWCSAVDSLDAVLARPDLKGIDQIPVKNGERIVAVWERSPSQEWARRQLDDSLLVSADAALWDFIHSVHGQSYRLVVEQTRITGIVTSADLLKIPVLVLAFSLVAELERAMNGRILERYANDSWVDLLEKNAQEKIRSRQRKLDYENLGLPTIELADLRDKASRIVKAAGWKFEKAVFGGISAKLIKNPSPSPTPWRTGARIWDLSVICFANHSEGFVEPRY